MNRKILSLITLLFIAFCSFLPPFSYYSYAKIGLNGTIYTDVLEDLKLDENFDEKDYPVNDHDYTLKVITITESNNKELFVYVYQPCTMYEILATSINFSNVPSSSYGNINLSIDEKTYKENNDSVGFDVEKDIFKVKNYSLFLIDHKGVFYKYKVNNYSVADTDVRYYEIISIMRKYNSDYDISLSNDNSINEVSYNVSKSFTFSTVEDILYLESSDVETISITSKYVGFVRLDAGFKELFIIPILGIQVTETDTLDCHYVAFSTSSERKIDEILEADVFFCTQILKAHYDKGFLVKDNVEEIYGNIEVNSVTLSCTDPENSVDGEERFFLFGESGLSYSFYSIQTPEYFFKSFEKNAKMYDMGLFYKSKETGILDDVKANISACDWVLNFYQTPYVFSEYDFGFVLNNDVYLDKTIVSEVMILRLMFKSGGKIYNLGVVDNKQSGGSLPSNYTKTSIEWNEDIVALIKRVLSVVTIILLFTYLNPILTILMSVISFIFGILKFVFKVLTLPFRRRR